jgi:exonuclease V gamma subunit
MKKNLEHHINGTCVLICSVLQVYNHRQYWQFDTAVTKYVQYFHQLLQLITDCNLHTAELLPYVHQHSVSLLKTTKNNYGSRPITHSVVRLYALNLALYATENFLPQKKGIRNSVGTLKLNR